MSINSFCRNGGKKSEKSKTHFFFWSFIILYHFFSYLNFDLRNCFNILYNTLLFFFVILKLFLNCIFFSRQVSRLLPQAKQPNLFIEKDVKQSKGIDVSKQRLEFIIRFILNSISATNCLRIWIYNLEIHLNEDLKYI